MAEITASLVKSLREKTGAGMMECKAALTEASGNEEQAVEILRKKGMATADKKAGRITAEGAVGSYIHMGGKVGVMVEINCETDFVARGDEFQQLVKDVAMHIAAVDPKYLNREQVQADVLDKEREILREQLKNDPKNASKPDDVLNKIIEGRVTAEGVVGSYIHMGGKVGVMVEINCETDFVARGEEFQQLVKDVAMHIAAVAPLYVNREEVPADVFGKEREIRMEQLKADPKNANKPAEILEKIIEGKMGNFYEESVLLDQPFVKDPSKTVGELVIEKIASIKENITVRRFTRYKMGEGIAKKGDDFAGEVASMVGN